MQLYDVYAKCNHRVAEGALFKRTILTTGCLTLENAGAVPIFSPMIVFTSFKSALTANTPMSVSVPEQFHSSRN
jgi:hypothetical protein